MKVDGRIRWLIEAKAASVPLRSRHLDQAELYAAEGNHPWIVLTNGVMWHLYHLTFDEGVEYEPVFEVDLSEDDASRSAEMLGMLHRSAILKGHHEDYFRHRQALDAASLGRALFTYETLRLVRRQLRKKEGVLLDVEDIASAIKDCFTVDAREKIGVVRIRRATKKRKAAATEIGPAAAPAPAPPAPPA